MNERIDQIENRLAGLEKTISNLETKLNLMTNSKAEKTKNQDRTQPPVFAEEKAKNKSELHSATQLLPLIAVICFLLAAVFMVRLAVDSGWLTVERQWGLLGILGFALAGAGRFLQIIEINYRSYLSAAGVVVLYIAAYSSSMYFHIVPQPVSLVFAMMVSGIALVLFNYHKSDLFPILASVGTYISPLLLGQNNDLYFHAAFFLIWASVFSAMSNYLTTRTLSLTSAYLGIGVFTLLNMRELDPTNLLVIIAVQFFQFLSFAAGVYLYSIKKQTPLSQKMAMAYLPILLFFYGTTYYFVDRLSPGMAPWISLVFGAIVYLLYRKAQAALPWLESQEMVYGFLAAILVHSGYLQILPSEAKPWLLPLFLLLSFVAKNKVSFPKTAPWISIIFQVIGLIEFLKISSALITTSDRQNLLPALLTVGVGIFYYLKGSENFKDKTMLFLCGLHLLSILSLYRIAFEYGSLAVSATWGIYSAVILTVGYQKKDRSLAQSSLVVLLITSLKALIYDASQAPSMIRIVSLLMTGAVLYGAGYLFQKIKLWG